MKRIITALITIAALNLPVIAFAGAWDIDPDHSNVGFTVRHMMVSNVKGNFQKLAGKVFFDDKDISKSKVDVTIETASINTNVQKRDDDLKSANFFDVTKFPTMTFVSKKVARAGKGKFKVTGDLTIHGVTREVLLDVANLSKESKDPWGGIRRGATATAKINRKDFGLIWNKTLETGGVLIGDEVAINLEIEMTKAKE